MLGTVLVAISFFMDFESQYTYYMHVASPVLGHHSMLALSRFVLILIYHYRYRYHPHVAVLLSRLLLSDCICIFRVVSLSSLSVFVQCRRFDVGMSRRPNHSRKVVNTKTIAMHSDTRQQDTTIDSKTSLDGPRLQEDTRAKITS